MFSLKKYKDFLSIKNSFNKRIFNIILLFLTVLFVVLLGLLVYKNSTKNQTKKSSEPTYATIDEALNSSKSPKLVNELKIIKEANILYAEDKYTEAAGILEPLISKGVELDAEYELYTLAINCYIKLNSVDKTKQTLLKYQKTKTYQSLDDEIKKLWQADMDELNKGFMPKIEDEDNAS